MSELFTNRTLESFRDLLIDFDDFIEQMPTRFNRILFRRIRQQTGSQAEWASLAGVSQTTIGNWERGFTPPQELYRTQLRSAAVTMRNKLVAKIGRQVSDRSQRVDIPLTERGLRNSILRAALTDFDFNPIAGQIVPVPFIGDVDRNAPEEIEEDRRNLLSSLSRFADIIVDSVGLGANINQTKFVTYLRSYAEEARSESPNARLLNRLGTTISRITNSDDFQDAVNPWDSEAVDGFNRDHIDLMRLYFREALAKAQEIDAAEVRDVVGESGGEELREVADLMETARADGGERIVDPAIPTLLRDIAGEIRDLDEAASFTIDPNRRLIFLRRKSEAFKNGGVYVGRFVFFSALVASLAIPGVGQIVGTLAAIVGLSEFVAPGTIRQQYDNLRAKFPALPPLPMVDGGRSSDNE